MLRVAVIGASGRMGSQACRAIDAAADLALVAAVAGRAAGRRLVEVAGVGADLTVAGDLEAITRAGADVAVDLTTPQVVAGHVRWLLDHDVHAVVGTSGLSTSDRDRLGALASERAANLLLVPNFAIGAVLMMRFAADAARHLPHAEIIELHHDGKADAPSGTALSTAQGIDAARREHPTPAAGDADHPGARGHVAHGVAIHSVRLPGLVAHQQVLLGGEAQTLTIRHDSLGRESFMPGVLLAVRRVADLDDPFVVGLDRLLE